MSINLRRQYKVGVLQIDIGTRLQIRRNDTPSDPRHQCEKHYLPIESKSVAFYNPNAGEIVAPI